VVGSICGVSAVELTVEQLATEFGLPTSTIRMYQTRGLLPPPRRHGRSVRYGDVHRRRLALVRRLQDRGFSLLAIGQLIEARARGASVADVLDLGGGGPDDWVPVRLRDVRKIISTRELRATLLREATGLGLVRWRKGRPYTRRWALDSGLRLTRLALPPEEVLGEYVVLRALTDQMAASFVAVFEQRLWPEIAQEHRDVDQLGRVRALLEELTDTAEGVVIGALRESVRAAAEDFARRNDLLPADGDDPAWLTDPVPALAENLTDATTTEPPDVEGFLSEVDAPEPPADTTRT
jgi:DNA-binding transcriptional MerR regulator